MDNFKKFDYVFKRFIFLLITICFVSAESAHALGSFEMGPEVSYISYEEPGVMEQKGMMYGVYAHYDLPLSGLESEDVFLNNSILSFDGVFKYGRVDYDSPVSGTLDDIDDYMFEFRGNLGHAFSITDNIRVTPYLGLGYRYLNDDSAGMLTSVGHAGYERESRYFYLPLGVKADTDLSENWNIGFSVEYDLFLSGKQKSHLEDVNPALNTIKNDQEDGYGLRGAIQLLHRSDTMDISFEPFVRWWNVDESSIALITCGGTPCALGYEPKNESLESGIRVGIKY